MKQQQPVPFTGYLRNNPDLVSSDFAEPRPRRLYEHEKVPDSTTTAGRNPPSYGKYSNIKPNNTGRQNTKIVQAASKPATIKKLIQKKEAKKEKSVISFKAKYKEYKSK